MPSSNNPEPKKAHVWRYSADPQERRPWIVSFGGEVDAEDFDTFDEAVEYLRTAFAADNTDSVRLVRCPDDDPDNTGLKGCGKTFTVTADDNDGMVDCPHCGLSFDPDDPYSQPQPEPGPEAAYAAAKAAFYTNAGGALYSAAFAMLAAAIRTEFPAATAVNIKGEYNSEYELRAELVSIVVDGTTIDADEEHWEDAQEYLDHMVATSGAELEGTHELDLS